MPLVPQRGNNNLYDLWNKGGQNGSFPAAAWFTSSPISFAYAFFFLLVGNFCLYLLTLFVAKQAEGGAPVCGWLLTLHPPFLPVLSASSKERKVDLPTCCCYPNYCCHRCRHRCCHCHPGKSSPLTQCQASLARGSYE